MARHRPGGSGPRRWPILVIGTTTASGCDVQAGVAQGLDQGRPGGVLPLPRRRSVRAGHDDGLVLGGRYRLGGRDSRRMRPPDFSSSSTRSMTMSRCRALAMSYSVRAATLSGGQRLHLDAGPGGGAALGADGDRARLAIRRQLTSTGPAAVDGRAG